MSLHDPLFRKRVAGGDGVSEGSPLKKQKSNKEIVLKDNDNGFSENMYYTYVMSALESLDEVSIFFLSVLQVCYRQNGI